MATATNANNAAVIAGYLAQQGFSKAQIAGVLGNLQVESNLSPTASNAREGAIGIAQWEGGRRTNLDAYAKATGGSETSLTTQLGFLVSELNGPESGALSALQSASTPAAAATAFDQKYERSSAASLPARVAAAQQWFTTGLPGSSDGAGGGATAGGGFASGQTTGSVQNAMDWNPLNWPADLTGAVQNGLLDSLRSIFAPVFRLLVDGFLLLCGVALIIVAVVLVAKGGESQHTDTLIRAGGTPAGGKQRGAGEGEGAGEGAAGDAAEAAVLA